MTWMTKGDDCYKPELSCSGRSAWRTMTRFQNLKRTDGGFRFRCIWLVGLRCHRRRLHHRWPKRTRRRCTIRIGIAIHWQPIVQGSTAACAETSTQTSVRRALHTPVRCQTRTSDRRNDEARREGNNLR